MFLLAALSGLGACAPKLSAGEWQCPAGGAASDGGTAEPPLPTDPVTVPWSTGFEQGFCDFSKVAGFCYGDEPYLLVTQPHRPGGQFAAEFKVIGGKSNQTRCVRQGALPESAYYGAWYFIAEPLKETDPKKPWNLLHFQGNDDSNARLDDLWDVNLEKNSQGNWELVVVDYVNSQTYRGAAPRKPVPIGSWFHIELFLKRARDATGEIKLYQGGALLLQRANLKSDASKFSQWYVGNWAENATPADSSLYVDDLSISATLDAASASP